MSLLRQSAQFQIRRARIEDGHPLDMLKPKQRLIAGDEPVGAGRQGCCNDPGVVGIGDAGRRLRSGGQQHTRLYKKIFSKRKLLSRKCRAAPSFLDPRGGRAGRSPALGRS